MHYGEDTTFAFFTEEETETQKDHAASQRQRWDSTPGHLTTESMLLN